MGGRFLGGVGSAALICCAGGVAFAQDGSADSFAARYVDDLQLPSELVATIAHAIREQVHTAKAKILRGNDDAALLKGIRTRWRESDKPTVHAPNLSSMICASVRAELTRWLFCLCFMFGLT